ncbi:MAG: PadR family transcriptional regulator [Acidobacteriota bacterium]|jgi:transcriptional regulator
MARKERLELLRGTLDLLVLQTLAGGAMHGYAIAAAIQRDTDELLRVEEGSLYPALHRMERRGWIAAAWGKTETNRRARFYELTDDGAEQLSAEVDRWRQFSGAVDKLIQPAS